MKKSELKAGDVLAHNTHRNYGTPNPVILVDADKLWREDYTRYSNTYRYSESMETRASGGGGYSYRHTDGYLVLQPERQEDDTEEKRIKRLRDAYEALAKPLNDETVTALANNKAFTSGFRFNVVNNVHLRGQWEAAKAADEEKREREYAEYVRERDAIGRELKWIGAMSQEMSTRGIDNVLLVNQRDGRVTINMASLGALLGIDKPEA